MKTALIQMTSSDDPAANLAEMTRHIHAAARDGAGFIATPEVCNCVSLSRTHQDAVLRPEGADATLTGLRDTAAQLGVWVAIGSLALRGEADARFVNRSFVIDPVGAIRARYDKIHMFDVTLENGETYAESSGYRPGDRAVLCDTPFARLGLSICYDLRFPALYRDLAQAGAQVLMIPAAFTQSTGAAHWEALLRARAIECGAYVIAAAQTGTHAGRGKARQTWGHSMVVSPWGEVLADAGDHPGITMVDLDMNQVARARRQMPSLDHDRMYQGPCA